ncbi:unnamed protein product [Staurois parvus]|uniref:Ribosomal protein L20 n=1 Tax=Staurois parvus TaxID=386267 RepID=A0ABN9B2N3_9NEOB|nr:unnamed protein product [Staurois parvus]
MTVCYKKTKTNNNIKKIKLKFWLRFMKKDYIFAQFYKKNSFFQNVWNFSFI